MSEIDTLKELREEKKRLRQEIYIARHYLDTKVDQTFDKGKRIVAINTSWPLVITSLAAFGAKQFSSSNTREPEDRFHTAGFNITDGIQEGIAAMQQPGNKKWYAILPLVLQFLEQWLMPNPVDNEQPQYRSNEYRPAATHHETTVPPTVPVTR